MPFTKLERKGNLAMPKKKSPPPKSTVIQLLDIVYDASLESTGHPWERLNTALHIALETAIGVGFKFDIDDWIYIGSHYRSECWLGSNVEYWYSKCVSDCNMSAIASFEKWKEREPFIADNVEPIDSKFAHMTGTRQTCRLAVGFSFRWKGAKVTVNSFGDGYVNAASYEGHKETPKASAALKKHIAACESSGYSVHYRHYPETRRPLKRFKITRQDLIDNRAETKRRENAVAELESFNTSDDRNRQIVKWLGGIKTRSQIDTASVELLESIVEKCRQKWPVSVLEIHGVPVSIDQCRAAWEAIQKAKRTKTEWSITFGGTEVIPVGPYQIRSISGEGDIRVGCKTIRYSELAKIAKRITPLPAK